MTSTKYAIIKEKILKWIVGIVIIFWILDWLNDSINANQTNKPITSEESTNVINIKKGDFKDWPFTVAEGRLWCDDGKVLFSAEGTLYGINGAGATFAKSEGGHDLKEIWAIDLKKKKELLEIGLTDKQSDAYMDITPILEKGKSLCK